MRTDEQLLQDMATEMRLAGLAERSVEAYTYAVRQWARCNLALPAPVPLRYSSQLSLIL